MPNFGDVKAVRLEHVTKIAFDRPCLLLVEGADDSAFASALLATLGSGSRWQVLDTGGVNTDWSAVLEVVLDDDWFRINGIAIGLVQDADSNATAAAQRCADILRRSGLPVPGGSGTVATGGRRTGYFVLPGNGANGALEHLLLAAVDPARYAEATDYLNRLAASCGATFANRVKNEIQTYLAGMPSATKGIPVGMSNGAFDPMHATFQPLRDFLAALT